MTFREGLIIALVVLMPFQDTILRKLINNPGDSFAIIPLALLIAFDCCGWLWSGCRRINRKLLAGAVYCVLLSLCYLPLVGTSWAGVYLPLKIVNLSVVTGLALYVVIGIDWSKFRYLRISVVIAFLISIAGVLLNDLKFLGLQLLVANPILHNTSTADERWRGLSSEASVLSVTLGGLGLLSAACARRPVTRIAWLLLTMLMLVLCGSKGGVITAAAVGLTVGLCARGQRIRILALLVILMPFGYIGYQRALGHFTSDSLAETQTVATRGALMIWSVDVIRHNPLGVGFAGFFPALTEYLPGATDQMFRISPTVMDFGEVLSYTTSAQNAGTKTLLADYGVFFGIPFLVGFTMFIFRIARAALRTRHLLLAAAILFVTFAMCTYAESQTYYNMFMVLGVGWSEYRRLAHSPRP